MTGTNSFIRIDAGYVRTHGLKWSGQNYFIFELDGEHPLLSRSPEIATDFCIFCHWVSGSAAIMSGQQYIVAGCNSVFTFLPGQRYHVNTSPGACIRGVMVAREFMERINFGVELSETMPYLLRNVPLYLTEDESDLMLQLLARLLHNNRQSCKSFFHARLQKAGFLMYSYELGFLYQKHAGLIKRPPTRRAEALYNGFLILLRTHFREERSVEFYAGMLAVTPNYFSEVIKSMDGRPAGQIIAETVMAEARSLLEETTLPVQEISGRLHFPDQATFAKYFKKHAGLSPKYYRSSVKG